MFQKCWSGAERKTFFFKNSHSNLAGRELPSQILFFSGMAERLDVLYPRNFFDAVRLGLEYVEDCRNNEGITKADALDGMEARLSFMMQKLLAAPTATSFCVFRTEKV